MAARFRALAVRVCPFPAGRATTRLLRELEVLRAELFSISRPLPVPTCFLVEPKGQLAAVYGLQNLHDWKLEKSAELARRADLIREAFKHPELKYQLISAGAYFAYIRHPFEATAREVVRNLVQQQELLLLLYFHHMQTLTQYLVKMVWCQKDTLKK